MSTTGSIHSTLVTIRSLAGRIPHPPHPAPATPPRYYKPEGHHAGLETGAIRGRELDGPQNVPLRDSRASPEDAREKPDPSRPLVLHVVMMIVAKSMMMMMAMMVMMMTMAIRDVSKMMMMVMMTVMNEQ